MAWIFGPGFAGHPAKVYMRELKAFDVPTRAKAFKARTDAFFIRQVGHFQTPSIWAPFTLAVMTCVGVEMIGSYKYGDAEGDRNDHFKKLTEDMDSRFADEKLTPDGKPKKLSYFIYKGFRNSLAHGFYGRWVFITHDLKSIRTFKYIPTRSLIVLNVYWFYRRFKEVYEDFFETLMSATNPTLNPLKTFNETFQKNFALWL